VVQWDLFPLAAAEEAHVVDDAFRLLMVLAVPVFAFTLALLVYSVLRFRRAGTPSEDGRPIRSHGLVVGAWLAVTTGLTAVMIIHPGMTGLADLRHRFSQEPDLVVQVEGGRWFWRVTYPKYGVTAFNDMVLPVNQRVRFEITSKDVLHAFWISAFRMKIDAVPGMVTTISAKPDTLGSLETDAGFRLQCAELCGLGHSVMQAPVKVVSAEQFQAWVTQQQAASR
jgi:cytochrome c oxidase subunit 2